jgi:uncharacterized protein (DUF305 family)
MMQKSKSVLLALSLTLLTPVAFSAKTVNYSNSKTVSSSTPSSMNQNYDAHFLDKLTQHHREGIEMAKIAKDKSSDAEVKNMSEQMINDHQKEIDQMQKWRKDLFSNVPQARDLPARADLSSLKSTSGEEFNKTYLSLLSKHYKSGENMMEEAKDKASIPEIREFARKGALKQAQEIEEMENMDGSSN